MMGPASRELLAFVYGAVVGAIVVVGQIAQLLGLGAFEVREPARRVGPESRERVCAALGDDFEARMAGRIAARQIELEDHLVGRLARFDKQLRAHEARLDEHAQSLTVFDRDLLRQHKRAELSDIRVGLAEEELCHLRPSWCRGPQGAPWKPSPRDLAVTARCEGLGIDGCDPRAR